MIFGGEPVKSGRRRRIHQPKSIIHGPMTKVMAHQGKAAQNVPVVQIVRVVGKEDNIWPSVLSVR
jgi:hypothetical protein